MTEEELNLWFTDLTVTQKEHIARKAVGHNNWGNTPTEYPECTRVWMALSEERKRWIHDHLTDEHGVLIREWQEGKMMSE